MEYIKGKPYFCFSQKQIKAYPYLNKDIKCDVLIIGGGIDGAIANYFLSQKYDAILVDKSRLGYGCTSCATALLEYQLDDFASDLMKYMSKEEIVYAYKAGIEGIKRVNDFIKDKGNHCEFSLRPTLLYTDSIFTVKDIEEEYEFRKQNGFDCELITEENNPFNFEIKRGIYCPDGGAEFNPYLFTKQMIENSSNQDKIFENTNITNLVKMKEGYMAETSFGEKIFCKKIVIATGFNWEVVNKTDLCERFITYSIVTEPIKDFTWHNKALVHDATSPYHYMRLLPDKRIIFGGEDVPFKQKPIDEKKANKIYDKLEKDLFELFPSLKGTKIDYKFCGSFGTTDNNLGIIGESDIDEDILYFISCGANGIINAMMGAEILEDIIKKRPNKLTKLFAVRP